MSHLFTQSACILTKKLPTIEELSNGLRRFTLLGPKEGAPGEDGWIFGGDGVLLSMEPELAGVIVVDVVDRAWPDSMGVDDRDGALFAAWNEGYFGPYSAPGNLARAAEQCWIWEGGAAAAAEHNGFIRIRSTFAPPSGGSEAVMPKNYNPMLELLMVTEVANALMDLEGAIAYFNPNGESLRSREALHEGLALFNEEGMPPLDVWANIRLHLNPATGWTLMDTVGMAQLQVVDHEACFETGSVVAEEVDSFLRNTTYSALVNRSAPENGSVASGPAGLWHCRELPDGLLAPSRAVVRWLPEAAAALPDGLS